MQIVVDAGRAPGSVAPLLTLAGVFLASWSMWWRVFLCCRVKFGHLIRQKSVGLLPWATPFTWHQVPCFIVIGEYFASSSKPSNGELPLATWLQTQNDCVRQNTQNTKHPHGCKLRPDHKSCRNHTRRCFSYCLCSNCAIWRFQPRPDAGNGQFNDQREAWWLNNLSSVHISTYDEPTPL